MGHIEILFCYRTPAKRILVQPGSAGPRRYFGVPGAEGNNNIFDVLPTAADVFGGSVREGVPPLLKITDRSQVARYIEILRFCLAFNTPRTRAAVAAADCLRYAHSAEAD